MRILRPQVWLGGVAFCATTSVAFCMLSSSAPAAEMGRAPVVSGTYATVQGGYLLNDGDSVLGHGISSTGLISGPTTETTVDARDGWFAGGSLGFASTGPIVPGLPFNRAEAYFDYFNADDGRTDTVADPAKTTLKSVDGSALGVIGFTATSEMHRRAYEGGVRFAFDQAVGSETSISWIVTPFVRNAREETGTVATGTVDTAWRGASVETWQYGVTLAAEPEIWVASNIALVGRIGGGIYGYDASGSFHSHSTAPAPDPFLADVNESASGVGFRGLLGAGVKVKLSTAMTLTGFAEADYFSHTGGASLPDNQFTSSTSSNVNTDDNWEFRAGARLSIGLGGGGN